MWKVNLLFWIEYGFCSEGDRANSVWAIALSVKHQNNILFSIPAHIHSCNSAPVLKIVTNIVEKYLASGYGPYSDFKTRPAK